MVLRFLNRVVVCCVSRGGAQLELSLPRRIGAVLNLSKFDLTSRSEERMIVSAFLRGPSRRCPLPPMGNQVSTTSTKFRVSQRRRIWGAVKGNLLSLHSMRTKNWGCVSIGMLRLIMCLCFSDTPAGSPHAISEKYSRIHIRICFRE